MITCSDGIVTLSLKTDVKRGSQFLSEPRRRGDVDEDLETKAAVMHLDADRFEAHEPQLELDGLLGGRAVGDVSDGVGDGQRQRQDERPQTDVDAHPDQSFDAARFQRVPLSPASVRRSSPVNNVLRFMSRTVSISDIKMRLPAPGGAISR